MIGDLQEGDTVTAEKIDRISRLPLPEAEQLINSIKAKGAKLAIPGIVNLTDLASSSDKVTGIVLNAVQDLLLRLALQSARDQYETQRERQRQGIQRAQALKKYKGRPPNEAMYERICFLRSQKYSIAKTAEIAGCSVTQVKRITKKFRTQKATSKANE